MTTSKTTARTLTAAAAVGALAVLIGGATVAANQASAKDGFEKCAGIVKAHQNDCANKSHSCAGQAAKDNEADSWIYLPTGTCGKIAGAHVVS